MCVIIFSPNTGNRPSSKTLELCNKANPHGIGIVTQGTRQMYTVAKGVSLDYAKKIIKNTDGQIAIHFRYATAGGISPELCHPFPCTPKAETWLDYEASDILMSNGTWKGWEKSYRMACRLIGAREIKETVSDSRAMAHIAGITNRQAWLKDIEDRHPMHKKVRTLLMSKTSVKRVQFFGDWHSFEGCKFSNMRWQESITPRRYKPSATTADFNSWLSVKF